jgi:single-strand DNA-binding protein
MSGVNKVILVGNLGADPELKSTTGGQQVAQLRVAVNESWTDKAGARQERTEWVRVVAWGRLADLCSQYLAKGRQVYVEGRLQTREWTDKENRRQFTTEVVAQNVVFLGGGKGASSEQAAGWSETEAEAVGTAPARAARAAVSEAEIPF